MICSFDWSQLNRYGIATYAYLIADKIIDRDLRTDQFYRIITTHLKKEIPLKFKTQIDKKTKKGWVYIGGLYYMDKDEQYQPSIKLVFQYRSRDDTIRITDRRYWRMCLAIADTILHEIIHMRQYRKRNFREMEGYVSESTNLRIQKEQEYLGCADEIDAYSFNIACELTEKFDGDRDKIINFLNEDQKNLSYKHNCWNMYLKYFKDDHNHPVICQVKKRVLYYLRAAKRGKPFISNSWICY